MSIKNDVLDLMHNAKATGQFDECSDWLDEIAGDPNKGQIFDLVVDTVWALVYNEHAQEVLDNINFISSTFTDGPKFATKDEWDEYESTHTNKLVDRVADMLDEWSWEVRDNLWEEA